MTEAEQLAELIETNRKLTNDVQNILDGVNKKTDDKLAELEEWKATVFKTDSAPQLQRYMGKIGYQPDYRRIVIPLVELTDGKGNRKSAWSYTSGHFEWIRTNGCCSNLGTLYIKAMKVYDSESMQVNILEGADNTNIKLVTFIFEGKKWGGLEIYINVKLNTLILQGLQRKS